MAETYPDRVAGNGVADLPAAAATAARGRRGRHVNAPSASRA
jgi:hypothetical protein